MKSIKILGIALCLSLFSFQLFSQTIEVSGSLSENTQWDVDTVKIIGDVTVEQNVLLTINPGVFIEAQGYYRLNVSGKIRAIGELNDTITFTVYDTTGFWADTLSTAGGWSGIYIIGEDGSQDSSVFKYCNIQYGKDYDEYGGNINGGALYVYNHNFLHINHCLFTNNMVICYTDGTEGPFGGAIYCEKVNTVLIDSSIFIRNRSFDFSGAIRIDHDCVNTKISSNLFIGNVGYNFTILPPPWGAGIGGGGAAISTSDLVYSPEISNNYCFNNRGLNGIIYTSNPNGLIYNNVICNNWGSGIADGHQLSTTRTFNNTIVNNRTHYGGMLIWSKAKIYNNILWGNVYYPGVEYDQIYIDDANPTLFFNCVQYGDGGTGAISDYPEFINPSEGVGVEYDGAATDWNVENWSPCINAGAPDTNSLAIPEFDILGNMRIFGNRIDMGAYENQEVWAAIPYEELTGNSLKIYPNPAKEFIIIIENDFSTVGVATISNINGQILMKENLTGASTKISIASLTPGIYFVKIDNGKTVEVKKVVKE